MLESSFPPLYARWVETLLGAPVPEERRATCGACPMTEGIDTEIAFNPRAKCCTFFPELPSFAVGGVFLDDDPAMERGRRVMRARIEEIGQQVTPLGLGPPRSFHKVYGRDETFGIAPTLRCPYYLDEGPGLCGIWRHREGVCATWFCKHERGAVGLAFWRVLKRLIKTIDDRLAASIARDLGIHEGALEAVRKSTATLHRDRDPDYYAAIWAPWGGREIDYYVASAKAAAVLGWDEVRARCGDALDPSVRALEAMWKELRRGPQLPDLVRIRVFRRIGKVGDSTLIKTYSEYDSLDLPDRTVAALLQRPMGKPEDLIRELGPSGVDRPLLEKMLDADLLEKP